MSIPLPQVTPTTAPFWDACRQGVLRVQHCNACGHHTFPPDVACNRCLSADLAWVACAGRGRLRSFSVVRRASQPAFQVPYVAAIVEVDEGWSLFTNLVDSDIERLRIGMPVAVKFVRMSEQISLPYFAPVALADTSS